MPSKISVVERIQHQALDSTVLLFRLKTRRLPRGAYRFNSGLGHQSFINPGFRRFATRHKKGSPRQRLFRKVISWVSPTRLIWAGYQDI